MKKLDTKRTCRNEKQVSRMQSELRENSIKKNTHCHSLKCMQNRTFTAIFYSQT